MGAQANCCQKQNQNNRQIGQIYSSHQSQNFNQESKIHHQESQQQNHPNQIRNRNASIYKIHLPTGSVYQGQIKNNLPHGKGVEVHHESEVYDGEFVQGKKQGFGKYKYSNGLFYEGQFKNNSMDGKGKLIWPCGDIYEGQFKDNMMNGEGVYTMAGGQGQYKGHYKQGKKHGMGEMKMKQLTYQGVWNQGVYMNSMILPKAKQ